MKLARAVARICCYLTYYAVLVVVAIVLGLTAFLYAIQLYYKLFA